MTDSHMPRHSSHKPARQATFRVSLQAKIVGFLLAISMVPLAVAAFLMLQTAEVAHNFATNEVAFLRPPLDKARSAYLELIRAKRDLYYPQVALRLAALPEMVRLGRGVPEPQDTAFLDTLMAQIQELAELTIHGPGQGPGGEILLSRRNATPPGVAASEWRGITIEEPIADTGATLALTFAASLDLQTDYAALSRALKDAERIEEVRSALPSSYRTAFLLLVGGVVLVVSLTGIWLARRFIRRIFALVSGTREVAAGNLEARVELKGRDELAELAWAFNRMVEDLEHDREQIAYLLRVSTWQDVARKLAHEIKNPLTPIQLAVQQCVSSYKGDDERFRRLLRDTEEIVTEEISSLRRLVDAFRTLGQLPRVDARPLALGTVVDDLRKDPALMEHLELSPPDEQVMIRGDRLLLRRVLTNLVENGMHAGKQAGRGGAVRITWRADPDAGRVVVTVEDQGEGVPEELRDKLFEPYVTSKEQGTGLGLTISKKIAIEHGGSLELGQDRAALGGARFVLTLPLADDAGAAGWIERCRP